MQSALRNTFDWRLASDYVFPEIRSLPGAMLMLTLVLYPYVYLLARAAFLEQSASILEAARAPGGRRSARFFRVALPMARPAIAVGLAMAMMETLNDYGTVDFFAVYQYASDELIAEAALGALLIVIVGLAAVILLTMTIDRSRELKAAGIATLGGRGIPVAA